MVKIQNLYKKGKYNTLSAGQGVKSVGGHSSVIFPLGKLEPPLNL